MITSLQSHKRPLITLLLTLNVAEDSFISRLSILPSFKVNDATSEGPPRVTPLNTGESSALGIPEKKSAPPDVSNVNGNDDGTVPGHVDIEVLSVPTY